MIQRLIQYLAAAGIVFFAAGANAMHTRSSATVRGFSKDGTAVLLAIDTRGPEGGGTTRLRLLESSGATIDALISDDMSAGGSERPQRVSPSACAEATQPLLARMAQLGFDGLAAGPKGCGIVGDGAAGKALEVKISGGQILIFDGGKPLAHVPGQPGDGDETEATASASGKVLVVLSTRSEPVVAFFSSAGGLAGLTPVHRKQP